jgi:hypothetical protein
VTTPTTTAEVCNATQSSDATRAAAELIYRYLARNPNASDTVEGVARWWLARQRRYDAVGTVEQALELLVREGVVTVSALPTGGTVYRLAQSRSEVETGLTENE